MNYTANGSAIDNLKGIRMGHCIYMNKALAEKYWKKDRKCK
jgi:hypothetical protein